MVSKSVLLICIMVAVFALISQHQTEARYLPTRSNGDRIDKLRELLKDLLESELEKEDPEVARWRPESKVYFKREAVPAPEPVEIKHQVRE
uniref:Proctolin n=1 Tax=Rhynchophorus ferrugineus TaxID=354439 RepID=A0A5Q0TX51_RHYFE|nr:proctolin [Rhynchophorus ferrugineus]